MKILHTSLLWAFLPLATAWAEAHERRILRDGVPLSPESLADARALGVQHPEKVRIMAVPVIPFPGHTLLRLASQVTRLIQPQTSGLSLRYGIYVRSELAASRWLIAHELVHTVQYERRGSMRAFLREYLHECLTVGYPQGAMEQEAILTTHQLRSESSG